MRPDLRPIGQLEAGIKDMLVYLGEDPARDGLRDTPLRVIQSWQELFSGYNQNPEDVFTMFDEPCDEMVTVSAEFFSTCEHHMLPFFGTAHIGYVPHGGKVIGASKLVRLLEVFSRRLQIQERICREVTAALMKHLKPLGAACVIEAKHLCMAARGVQKQHSVMRSSSMVGVFRDLPQVRAEFLSLVKP